MRGTFLFALFLLLASFTRGERFQQDPNAPVLEFERTVINFGTITQGTIVDTLVNFKNTGKQPLIITSVTISCGCMVADWPKEPILPGRSGKIRLTFNSIGKMGLQDRSYPVNSNNRDGVIVLHLKGKVEAKPAEEKFPPGKKPAIPENR